MKTYLLYQNGNLTMKEKQENTKINKLKISLNDKINQRQSEINKKNQQHQLAIQQQHIQQQQSIQPIQRLQKPIQQQQQPFLGLLQKSEHKISGGKNKNSSKNSLFSKLCKIIKIDGNPLGKIIPFDTLNDPLIIKELYEIQEQLKEVFSSTKLTSLHMNAIKKQSFPGVNIVRQIFKEMGYKLKPINISEGYLGNKKLLRREYLIKK